ncbi:MAG: hypothetical protein ACYS4W_12365, partial [Planctomycetota bacterium]
MRKVPFFAFALRFELGLFWLWVGLTGEKLALILLRQPGFVQDFAAARGLRQDKLGLFFGSLF